MSAIATRKRVSTVTLALVVCGVSSVGEAHPHETFTATVAPLFDPAGRLVAVREVWTFGYDLTTALKPLVDDNRDGTIDQAELEEAPRYALSWMAESGYYTRVTLAGRPTPVGEARDVSVRLQNGHISVDFTLPLRQPQRVKSAGVDAFDSTLYYAIEYAYPDIDASTAPASCTVDRRWSANVDPLAPDAPDPADGYAVRVQIDCSP